MAGLVHPSWSHGSHVRESRKCQTMNFDHGPVVKAKFLHLLFGSNYILVGLGTPVFFLVKEVSDYYKMYCQITKCQNVSILLPANLRRPGAAILRRVDRCAEAEGYCCVVRKNLLKMLEISVI